MPKTPSRKLFELIKSLSGSEKRYFKIFSRRNEAGYSKYEQLFDAIEAQEQFDEEELKQIIYGEEPLESRKYSELKAYLYELILKSLQSYDEKSASDYRIKQMLLGVRTLFRRSCFEDCKDLLKKARKLATSQENFTAMVEILDWEKKIAYTQMDIDFLDRELMRIMIEEKAYIEKLQNIQSYRSLFFKVLVSVRKGESPGKTKEGGHPDLLRHPLMKDESMALSFQAKVMFHRIRSIHSFSVSDAEGFYQSGKQLIKLMEGHPSMLREDVSEYISALNNFIISCGKLGKYREVRETLKKLSRVTPITFDDEVKIHRQYYSNKFSLCIYTGEFEEGKRELERHLEEMEKLDKKVFLKSDYYFQYFYIYFGCGEYEKALGSLNDWLGSAGTVERKDLQSLSRILNLIIHYELGNWILLDNLVRSTRRFLTREERLSELERRFIQFMRDTGKFRSKKELKQAFAALKEEVENLVRLPSYKVLDLFDIRSWLDSKISGKPFARVVKEKYSLTVSG